MVEFNAIAPATGNPIAGYQMADAEQITTAMSKARQAFSSWQQTPLSQRLGYLKKMRNLIIADSERIVAILVEATGKAHLEALAGDIFTCVASIKYYEKNAGKILRRQRRSGHLLFPKSKFYVEYAPIGVVAIFSPWNYPLQLAVIPIITALVAGNTVILKPSEVTPSVGALVQELCRQIDLPDGVVQVLQGDKSVGQALIQARPDKIFFTGSAATGKKVMAAAAEQLIPIELELGGKDPMIVFADANFERAVQGAVYGALSNAGQACVSVERLYVHETIHDRFVEAVCHETAKVIVGQGINADIGCLTNPPQRQIIDSHIDDALDKGAQLATERRVEANFYYPLVVTKVNHSMRIMQEETFGPVLPIMPFSTEAEVIALANDSVYGLNASIWTRDLAKGERVARQLITGNCAINDVIKNIGNPHMPFGGEKQSGFGRYHGPEGLYSFSRQKAVMCNRGTDKRELNWFPYNHKGYRLVNTLIQVMYSNQSLWRKLKKLVALIGKGEQPQQR